ncbi:MAG TPA: cytochrome c biogenesis protein CcsA [Angustibacter sp.]|nr:cytochrome c biogenesis protein CcsA [Angustibacter sp.]
MNPASTRRRPVTSAAAARYQLLAVAAVTVASAVVAAVAAPEDAVQGQWQRLMYVHVPAAWTAYLAFAGVLAFSVKRLRAEQPGRQVRWDRWSQAASEVGVVSTAVALASGSLWGHGVWGVWWAWDPRLVSTALMLVVYVAHLGALAVNARRAAWLGIASFAVVPLVHFSVVWWQSLHQAATVLGPPREVPPIDPRMAVALALAVVAATAVALCAVSARVRAIARTQGRATPEADASAAEPAALAAAPR